ncbi:MAG: UDP-N-acetylmuramoyl-tripeptide--D-alanyl-D-alanine ligase [Waddliaceae bacterium]
MRIKILSDVVRILEEKNDCADCREITPSFYQLEVSGFCVDSRLLSPNTIFFALQGNRVDGHAFIPEAAAKGAVAAVVDRRYRGANLPIPLIYTDNVAELLQLLAQIVLQRRAVKIVGVTGSVGKTTTKDFIATLLTPDYHVFSSLGNRNSQIGLPLTILNDTTGEEDILVLEMSMDAPLHIHRLVQIAPPDIAVITSVALVHAFHFETLGGIAKAKGEIFSHPKTSLGILSRDIRHFSDLCKIGSCDKVSFSVNTSAADVCLVEKKGVLWVREQRGKWIELKALPVYGRHNRHNFLAAVAVARNLGISWPRIRRAMQLLTLPENRCTIVEREGITFVNDAYNASIPSVKAALADLPNPKPWGRKIAVLGEMKELGKFSVSCHRQVGEYALDYVDSMWCVGEECQPIVECWEKARRPVAWCKKRSEIVELLRDEIRMGDVVLLKGSRALEMDKVLPELFP